jgi:nitroimidazol reductase NimA-like FMN-containing flavoprotein (pyridoxamine 5'-phosphate oxidase superfamily)
MEHIEYAYTHGMDDAQVDERLRTAQTGVLSLEERRRVCDPGGALLRRREPLLPPREHGREYETGVLDDDRDAMLRPLRHRTDSRPERTRVVVTGRLSEVAETEHDRFDTAAINRRFSPIRVFDEPIDDIEITIVELEVDTVTGRSTVLE